MSFSIEYKIQESCAFCYKVLCDTDIVILNDDVLKQLKTLSENIVSETYIQIKDQIQIEYLVYLYS